MLLGEVDSAVVEDVGEEADAFGEEPDWGGEEEGADGAVAEEVEFVESAALMVLAVCFGAGGFGEEFLGEDVLRYENDCGEEGGADAPKVRREVG